MSRRIKTHFLYFRDGFSLLETIIYIALFMSIATGLLLFLQVGLSTETKTNGYTLVTEELQFILGRIDRRIQGATAITTPTAGTSGTSLVLTMASSTENPTRFTLSNGILYMTRGSGAAIALSSVNVQITNLSFTHLLGTPDQVRVNLTAATRTNGQIAPVSVTSTDTFTVPR